MADEYISRNEVIKRLEEKKSSICPIEPWEYERYRDICDAIDSDIDTVQNIQSSDVVARDCYDRILWENDVMRKQLAEIGKGFGQRMDDVRHVVHARWIELDECSNEGVYCSNCQKKVYKFSYSNTMKRKSNFCPNCGAKMDKED